MSKIKKFDNFNESITEKIVLTMDDVRSLKNNLGGRDSDPVKNFGWSEEQTLEIFPSSYDKPVDYNGRKIQVCELFTSKYETKTYRSHLGYAVLIDDKPEYLVSIYEPHGYELLEKRNLLIVHGHEEITLLWLDNGEFNTTHTR